MNRILRIAQIFRKALLITGLVGVAVLTGGCGKKEGPGKAAAVSSQGTSSAFQGYTLVSQLMSNTTDLIDMEGRVVHRWSCNNVGGGSAYLLPDGDLLRTTLVKNNPFNGSTPGLSGMAERYDWDSKLKWSFTYVFPEKSLHHDIRPMPNGNVLMVGVEVISKERQIELGRDPARAKKDLWLDFLIEVKPTGQTTGDIVWEWHLVDHLIQEFDKTKKNYGVVADHPELLDVNAVENPIRMNAATLRNLQSIGYVGQAAPIAQVGSGLPDWTHVNSITYNPKLDQVLMSVRSLGEVWIIDHSPTTQEAVGHEGGKHAKGGDLIYRWGNPQLYQRGQPKEQMFFGQHDAEWVPEGCPGAGDIMVFNNGEGRKDGEYTTIDQITPPLKKDGSYEMAEGQAYGPAKVTWHYQAENKTDFHSSFLSGVQRLPNGNTLICSGVQGRMFEVGAGDKIVWEQDRKVAFMEPGKGGGGGPGGPGGQRGQRGNGPGGPGGQRQGGRGGGGGVAMTLASFSVSGTGQVAAFGNFEFFKIMSANNPQRRGPGGPGGGPGGPGGPGGGPGGPPGGPGAGPQGPGPGGAGPLANGNQPKRPPGPGGPQGGAALGGAPNFRTPPGGAPSGPPGAPDLPPPGGPDGAALAGPGPGGPGPGGPGGQGGPGGGRRGPGGPGGGRRPGGPGAGGTGGLFRALRYGTDYEAFVGRKLEPLSETELSAGMPFTPPDGPPEDMPPPPPNAPYPPNFRRQPSPAPAPEPGK